MIRKFLFICLTSLLFISNNSWAAEPMSAQPFKEDPSSAGKYAKHADDPSFASSAIDAVIARPTLFALTVVGTGLFVVTLPFTALSNSVPQARDVLIKEPAEATFKRCLGCSYKEDTEQSSTMNKP